MSYTINCRKCDTKFLKVSMKSKETVCHSCRRRNRNAMVAQPYEEMTKSELIRLLQDMTDKQQKMDSRLAVFETKLGNMYNNIATSAVIKQAVTKAVEEVSPEMKALYIKHNNRILKLEKKVFATKNDEDN
jgi:Mg2+ and Co2+ transporter CorA